MASKSGLTARSWDRRIGTRFSRCWSCHVVDLISGVREFGVGLVSWSLVATSAALTRYRWACTGGDIQVLEETGRVGENEP